MLSLLYPRARTVPYNPLAVPAQPSPNLPAAAIEQLDALYRLARHLTGDEQAGQDLVQDTYARAMETPGQFTPGTNVRAWLFRILRNLHIDRWRSQRTKPALAELTDDEPGEADREPLRGDHDLQRLRRVVASDIEAALRTLSIDARTIILLDLEGFNESELAEILGCTLGTVKSRLSRARAALRQRLHDYAR